MKNRASAEFAGEFNIDINDDVYYAKGSSKAKRLRCFLKQVCAIPVGCRS